MVLLTRYKLRVTRNCYDLRVTFFLCRLCLSALVIATKPFGGLPIGRSLQDLRQSLQRYLTVPFFVFPLVLIFAEEHLGHCIFQNLN